MGRLTASELSKSRARISGEAGAGFLKLWANDLAVVALSYTSVNQLLAYRCDRFRGLSVVGGCTPAVHPLSVGYYMERIL